MSVRVRSLAVAIGVLAGATTCSGRPGDAGVCEDGDSVPAGDGCNTCDCSSGWWGVTELSCGFGLPQSERTCYEGPLGDVAPEVDELQVECWVSRWDVPGQGANANVPACVRVEAIPLVPIGADVCFFVRDDPSGTGDPQDDVSEACLHARGELFAAEIELFFAPRFVWGETTFTTSCRAPEATCPGWDDLDE